MSPTDVTVEILKSIRDEVRLVRTELSERLDATRAELGERIDTTRNELSNRIVESEMRTATAITDLHGTVRDLVDVLRDDRDLRPRVDRCERDIGDIKQRLGI